MRNKSLFRRLVFFGLVVFVGCQNDVINPDSSSIENGQETTRVESWDMNTSDAVKSLHQTILKMSGSEYRYELDNFTAEQLTEFAADLLIEDSKLILLENGYNEALIEKEFGKDRVKIIHKAIEIYSKFTNQPK